MYEGVSKPSFDDRKHAFNRVAFRCVRHRVKRLAVPCLQQRTNAFGFVDGCVVHQYGRAGWQQLQKRRKIIRLGGFVCKMSIRPSISLNAHNQCQAFSHIRGQGVGDDAVALGSITVHGNAPKVEPNFVNCNDVGFAHGFVVAREAP